MPRTPRERPTHLTIDGQAVEIRRSTRRRRTISARVEDGVVIVLAPATMSTREEMRAVEDLIRRVTRKRTSQRNDAALSIRAAELSRAHLPGSPLPTSVRWVSNMTTRWASCTPSDGSIRMSDTMIGMPGYVIDAVLVHELAHLLESGHGPRFQALVGAFEPYEKAQAFLAGASFGARQASGPLPDSLDEPPPRPGSMPGSPTGDDSNA